MMSSFFALTLLLMSYYLLKPLRASYFYKEFDPDWLPRFYLAMPILSLLATRLFNFFYTRLERFPLIAWTYGLVIGCKVVFNFSLPQGSQTVIVIFYFFTTVYFLLCMAVMWACLSSIFDSLAGERTFSFISFGGMVGAVLGSTLSGAMARSAYKDHALLVSAVLMFGALMFLRAALRNSPPSKRGERETEKADRSWMADFAEIWKHRYLRAIALMVMGLAFMNSVLDFVSSRLIDHHLAKSEYREYFGELPEEGFDLIYGLKELESDRRQEAAAEWLSSRNVQLSAETLLERYELYREEHEKDTRLFHSRVNAYHNLFGMLIMLLVARALFLNVGVKKLLVLMPTLFLFIGSALLFPLELTWVFGFLVTVGTVSYSINKTSKELLFTETDEQARFRFKPLIGGPLHRFGDVGAALIRVVCADLLKLGDRWSDAILLSVGLPLTLWWLVSVWTAGKDYEARREETRAAGTD